MNLNVYYIGMNTKDGKIEGGNMEELDLKELFSIFWSKKIYIVLIVLIFIAIGVIYTVGFTTPMYSSSTTLVLAGAESAPGEATNSITTTDVTLNSKLVSTYSVLVKSKDVLNQVVTNLGIDMSWESLKNNVSVSLVDDADVIEISVETENAEYSAKIANEIAKVFTEKVAEIYNIYNVHVVDEAEVENTPSNINHERDIIIFAFIGLVIAIVYVLIANMLDTTIKTAEDIEKEFKLPVLASIPIYGNALQKKKGGRK